MKNVILIALYCIVILFSIISNAQRIPYSNEFSSPPTALEDKVNKSDAIVEGMVINNPKDDYFLLDPNSKRPFTSVIIKVSKVFKGTITDSTVELIVDGGMVSTGISQTPAVQIPSEWGVLGEGFEGMFFLRVNNTNIKSGKKIKSFFYLYPNSLILYNNPMHTIYATAYYEGKNISDFEHIIYQPIEAITGQKRKILHLNSFEAAQKQKK